MHINPEMTITFLKMFYKSLLRDILLKVVMDSKYEWDDTLLELTDSIFDYKKE